MDHPENVPQHTLFVRQNEEITRLSLRVAMKIIREELGKTDFQDEEARSRIMHGALLISESMLNRIFNLSAMLRQTSPTEVDQVYDSVEKMIDAMTRELKK